MRIESETVEATTDESGDAVAYSNPLNGTICQVEYVKHATSPFADGVDFNITVNGRSQTVWVEDDVNATTVRAPKTIVHTSSTGAAFAYILGDIVLADERVKFTISSGGDTKIGTFIVLYMR